MKEFPNKEDAIHWLDVMTALSNKKLLKGQIDLLKTAAANRKATQEAYEKIIQAKQVFVPENNPAFMKKPAEGKDIYDTMFERYSEPPKPKFPESTIRVPQTCLDRLMVMGYESPVIAELLGWKHSTLGWRVTDFITHTGDIETDLNDILNASSLTHLGFIRCGPNDPELTDDAKNKLKRISENLDSSAAAMAIIVTYPASHLYISFAVQKRESFRASSLKWSIQLVKPIHRIS